MKIILLILVLMTSNVLANEIMTPDTAIPADPQNRLAATSVHIGKVIFDYDNAAIEVTVDNGSVYKTYGYIGSIATTLMNSLNTMNFSVNSFKKKVFQQLNSDGKLPGTISGSPD